MCVLTLQVIEVKASVRTGKDDFVLSLRKSLKDFYGDKVVGLGGVFLIEKGSAHIHIMVGKDGLAVCSTFEPFHEKLSEIEILRKCSIQKMKTAIGFIEFVHEK